MRARELGIIIGTLPPGPNDAITDVPGVRVGSTTLIEEERSRLGGRPPIHTSLLCGLSQLRIEDSHLRAQNKTLLIFRQCCQFVGQFLAACLHSEIGLTQGNNRFRGIGVLNNQVTGVA